MSVWILGGIAVLLAGIFAFWRVVWRADGEIAPNASNNWQNENYSAGRVKSADTSAAPSVLDTIGGPD